MSLSLIVRAMQIQMSEAPCVRGFVHVLLSLMPFAFKMEGGDVSFGPERVSLLLVEMCWARRLQPVFGRKTPKSRSCTRSMCSAGGRGAKLAPCPRCVQPGQQRTALAPVAFVG